MMIEETSLSLAPCFPALMWVMCGFESWTGNRVSILGHLGRKLSLIKISLLERTSAQNFRAVTPHQAHEAWNLLTSGTDANRPLCTEAIQFSIYRSYRTAAARSSMFWMTEKAPQTLHMDSEWTPNSGTWLYSSAVLLSKVWRWSRGSGLKLISRQSIPIDKDLDY